MPSITHRHDYEKASLDESAVDPDPIRQFQAWFDAGDRGGDPRAERDDGRDGDARGPAVGAGRPDARVRRAGVRLLHQLPEPQGAEIEANPFASLVFFWQPMERQVRVEGRVVRASEAESDEYFRGGRPGSKLGAWVSNQSGVVPGRAVLEAEMEAIQARFPGDEIPRPPHWGGYRVVPEAIEFWQGAEEPAPRPDRLPEDARGRLADRATRA